MRATLLFPLAAVLLLAGCQRDDYNAVPDRGGHAFNQSPTAGSAGGGDSAANDGPVAPSGAPGPGEEVITVAYDDSLYKIADRYGVTLRWLIERNQMTRRARAGDRLIVPAR